MNKKSFVSFALLLTFWFLISGTLNIQHIIVGVLLSLLLTWFWKESNPQLPTVLYPRELLLFGRSMMMLIGYVIKSNIVIAKTLLFSDLSEASMFLELTPGMKSDWGRVLLATCITITPGTITVDVYPETGIFSIHAINRETGEALYYWRVITEIKNLETMVERREAHVVDTCGVHSSNTASTTEGGNRTNSN